MIQLLKDIIVWSIAIAITIFIWPLVLSILLFAIYAIVGYLVCAWIVAAIRSGMD
tara:strand:+ start:247 stop:411 length:165 start_codon:yes stop_codon:yes gene_type:complete